MSILFPCYYLFTSDQSSGGHLDLKIHLFYGLTCSTKSLHMILQGSFPRDVHHHAYGDAGVGSDHVGREARVSRYREKRRTRLFSKKIRYEVRKLNAEKRPRMKGRFVKRTS